MESYEQGKLREKLREAMGELILLSDEKWESNAIVGNLLNNFSLFFIFADRPDIAEVILWFLVKEGFETHVAVFPNLMQILASKLDYVVGTIPTNFDSYRSGEEPPPHLKAKHEQARQSACESAQILHDALKAVCKCSHPDA